MSNLYIKTKIRSGPSALDYLKRYRDGRTLVVCDRFLAENKTVRLVTEPFAGGGPLELFDQVVPDPTAEIVGRGLAAAVRLQPDVIIGFGGGSAIDTAKGIIYFAKLQNLLPKVTFITIPTTSGTGSEVTSATVITDTENRSKHLAADDSILADLAILDARLTLSVPPAVTANTGMDVLTHAVESYVAADSNVFSDALSEKSVELLLGSLLTCYVDGQNLEARTRMQEASTLAGMAFNTAGLGLNHSIAHQLGGAFHIPHGLANALLLTRVIDYNSAVPAVLKKYAALACKVKLADFNDPAELAAQKLKKSVEVLMECMKMPRSVSETGVSRDEYESQLDRMAGNALSDTCLAATPRAIDRQGVKELFMSVY